MSTRFACSRSEFKSWISLLIFCLVDLSNIDSGVLVSHYYLWESKSLYKSLRTCLMYLGAPVFGVYIFRILSSSCCINPRFVHFVYLFQKPILNSIGLFVVFLVSLSLITTLIFIIFSTIDCGLSLFFFF